MATAIVEASIIIRCINRASAQFAKIGSHAKTVEERLKRMSRGIAGVGALTLAAGRLAGAMGILPPEVERVISAVGSLTIAIGILAKTKIFATAVTWAYNASLTVKLALLTVGIGVVIAMAAAMAMLAQQTAIANRSMREFSAPLSEAGGHYGIRHEGYGATRRGMER